MTIAATSPLGGAKQQLVIMVCGSKHFRDQIGENTTPAQVRERIYMPMKRDTGMGSFLSVPRPFVVIQSPEDGFGWIRIDGGHHTFMVLELIFCDSDRHPENPEDGLTDFENWTHGVAQHIASIANKDNLRMEDLIETTPPEKPGIDQQSKGDVWLSMWTLEIPHSS